MIKKVINKQPVEDVVNINDVTKYKIYATYIEEENRVYRATYISHEHGEGVWCFASHEYFFGEGSANIIQCVDYRIKGVDCCAPGSDVYQFNTEEEFLRWALEKITGKRFKSLEPGGFYRKCPNAPLEVFS